jgi:hypothetical protein
MADNRGRKKKVKAGEVNYKKDFCLKYFDKKCWSLDVLNQVDVLLQDKKGNYLLYIESKSSITGEAEHKEAIAQVILTNKKQEEILTRVALIYKDGEQNDVLELIDCSDDSVMYNNDFNWKAEKASSPSADAIARINDRVQNKITFFRNKEIKTAYEMLKKGREAMINITEKNVNVVYNQWKKSVRFHEYIADEQELINLFLADLLKRTTYGETLVREGTNLFNYRLMFDDGMVDGIKYKGQPTSYYYHIEDKEQYTAFWKRYKRPPEKSEFLKIKEHSSTLYSERYRRDTGGEYTPSCFVETQNEILAQHYDMNDFIVCDPCAGVGNLENQFGRDYKQYCYLSTLAMMDVDTCKIKGFDNAIKYDYFANREQPRWKYRGEELDIREIAHREQRKLMVIMNPPYQQKKGFKNDLAIEFFNKVLELQPEVIVFYCKTEFFLRQSTCSHFVRSGYKVMSHIFSSAKDTFKLSDWAVSQVVFDRENGQELTGEYIAADRYELNRRTDKLEYKGHYTYDNVRLHLITEIEQKLKQHATGITLGQWTNQNYCLVLSNRKTHSQHITTGNLVYALLLKGINFNTHGKYFETSNLTYRGRVEDISPELWSDAIMFSLFYLGLNFSNKEGQRNFVMPFTAEQLGCSVNDLNVLFYERGAEQQQELDFDTRQEEMASFDFRQFLQQFTFSAEAKALYDAALDVFRYYHHSHQFKNRDYNDSFYDITNAIMGKDTTTFQTIDADEDRRITKVKTTKGTKGFGRNTIQYAVDSSQLPVFARFFDARDTLAKKINRQLVEQGLLLWERENIY